MKVRAVITRILVVLLGLLTLPAGAFTLENADFADQAGEWRDGEGPPGWTLSLDRDDQLGIVEDVDFAVAGGRAFRFNALGRGFGDSRVDQCVALDDHFDALMLSVHIRTDEPDPELALRLRVDFYADEVCDSDSANADAEQIGTDVGLSGERVTPGEWARIESATRLASELGEDVRSARVSIRLRDRSSGGQPREPARVVWFDQVSLQADVVFLPPAQRAALRELYQATNGPGWHESLGWMDAEGTECRWHGVTCSPDGASLLRLDLSGNGLLGELPASITALDDLAPGEGLDLCWNDVLVGEDQRGFVNERHLGGDPGFCQGLDLQPFSRLLSGNYYQPAGRDGEGFSLTMLSEGSALFYWATYDDFGEPLWLFGSGRADGRVLRLPNLYVTHLRDGSFGFERAGRAALVIAAGDDDPECGQAIFRFSAEGDGFGARDGREMITLDGRVPCEIPTDRDPLIDALAGIWFDPALDGQGLSFTPHSSDRIVLNWFGYDAEGEQVWRFGVGSVIAEEQLIFNNLLAVRGGSFNGPLTPEGLEFDRDGSALLTLNGDGWVFELTEPDGRQIQLDLQRIEAGPSLLASTGRRIDLSVRDDDLIELYSRSPFSDDRLPGEVRFDRSDEVQALTGFRFRGSSSRQLPKKSFNIRFESPQPLLFGSDRMNLNAMYTDPTMVREALSFELFHELGHPAPRTRHFDLWINEIYEGTYIHIQRVDETLLGQNGLNPNGTLVRDQIRSSDPDTPNSSFAFDLTSLSEQERLDFVIENFDFRGDPEWTQLVELIEWVQATPPGPDFLAGFEQRFEVENFIDWLVLHWLIGDIDSFGDDYWLYLDHENPNARWVVIPWDKDLSFGSHFRSGFFTTNDFFIYEYRLGGGWNNLLIDRFLATPELRLAADTRLLELAQAIFPPSWFEARVDELIERLHDSINIQPGPRAFAVHNQNHFSTPELFADQVEALLEFVNLRLRFIERQLAAEAGELYQAEATIDPESVERTFLTDVSGWTMATVQPLAPTPLAVNLEMSVEENAALVGIDREWTLEVSGGPLSAELRLYYRNEITRFWGRGNWWTFGDEAIGDQPELQLMFGMEGGALQTIETTRINPIANMASAPIELTPGRHTLRLVLPMSEMEQAARWH